MVQPSSAPTPPASDPFKGPPSTWPAEMRRGMAWRVGATILLGTAWLAFLLLYAFLWSGSYSLFQNVVVVLVSLVAVGGGCAGVWASWGMRYADLSGERIMREGSVQTRRRTFLLFTIVWQVH